MNDETKAHVSIAGCEFSDGPAPWALFEDYQPGRIGITPVITLTPGTQIEALVSGPVRAVAIRVVED